jgi:hypothetical protein
MIIVARQLGNSKWKVWWAQQQVFSLIKNQGMSIKRRADSTTEGDACKLRDSSGQFIRRLVQALLCEQWCFRWMWQQTVLVRGVWPARWEPQEEGMMSAAATFPSVRNQGLSTRRRETMTTEGVCGTCTHTNKYFAPNLRWGCQSHRFAWNKGYECIEWKIVVICE